MSEIIKTFTEAIERLNSFLEPLTKGVDIPISEYESFYKKAINTKKFFDNASWDIIQEEVKEDWIPRIRKDEQFKEYYKLRMEIDRLALLL